MNAANPMPDWLSSSPQWTTAFAIAVYAMTIGCVYHAVRVGAREGSCALARRLCTFSFLVWAFWFVESLAHYRTPYYAYSIAFHDLLPFFRFQDNAILKLIPSGFDTNVCTRLVSSELHHTIPFCVVLFEASLAYAAMSTASLLSSSLYVQPFLAGFALVVVDALLDPIVSISHQGCSGRSPGEAPGSIVLGGLGLWHWFLPQARDLGTGEKHVLGTWFFVPVFNFAAWLVAPVVAVAIVNGFLFARRWGLPAAMSYAYKRRPETKLLQSYKRRPRAGWTAGIGGWLALVIGGGATLWAAAPNRDFPEPAQYLLVLAAVVATGWFLFHQSSTFKGRARVERSLTIPVVFSLVVAVAAGLFEHQFARHPWLMVVAVVVLPLGLWLAWLPYREMVLDFIGRVEDFDRFVRAHYFGFTAMLMLGGAALSNGATDNPHLLGLFLVAICFHVFSYVLNDVIDLKLDRTQARRQKDPLVRGAISKQQALAIALSTIPLALLATLHMVNFEPLANPWAFITLLSGFALMTIYNLYGKKVPHAWITDLAQGVSWGSLALFGALAVSPVPHPDLAFAWDRAGFFFVYGALFIFLINGIHGGLRDLSTDRAADKYTLSRLLGAKVRADGEVESSLGVKLFAHVVHGGLFAAIAIFVWKERAAVNFGMVLALSMLLFGLVNLWALHQVVKTRADRRGYYVSTHVFTVLLPPLTVFLAYKPASETVKVVTLCSFLVPLLLQEGIFRELVESAYRRQSPTAEPPAPPYAPVGVYTKMMRPRRPAPRDEPVED